MTSPFHTSLVGFFLQLQQTFTQRVTKDSKPHVMEDFSLLRLPSSFFYYLLHLHFNSFLGCCSAHWQLFGLCIDLHTTTSRSNTAFCPNNERKLLNGGIGVREPQRLRFRGLTCKSCLMSLPQSCMDWNYHPGGEQGSLQIAGVSGCSEAGRTSAGIND